MAVKRLVLSAVLSAAAFAASAQLPEFRVGSERVMLSATAVDRRGRVVRDLRQEEIRVFEDGRPQRVVHFDTAQLRAARILLLVDTSGSMAGNTKTTSTRMALVQLLASLAPEDRVALVGFDHEYHEWVP